MKQTDSCAFESFWAVYPKRQAKKDAQKAWDRLQPSPALVQEMLTALAWQVASVEWLKNHGQFVPLPASWIRGERWMDEASGARPPLAFAGWACDHTPPCEEQWRCYQRTEMDAMRRSG